MALEDEIKALTAAVKENTAALKESAQVRAEALTIAKATVAGTGETPTKEAETKATETKAADPDPVSDVTTELRELIASYFAVERAEERKARQEKVIALLNHEKIKKAGVPDNAKPDVANIAPEAIELFKKQMALLKEKGDLTVAESDTLV